MFLTFRAEFAIAHTLRSRGWIGGLKPGFLAVPVLELTQT